jgi:cytochrome c556
MHKRVVLFSLAGLLALGTTGSLPATAQTSTPADIILTRQAGYSLLGATFGGLKTAIDAKVDVKPLAARADAMAKWGASIPLAFPKGSDVGYPTKALPTIWSDRAGFEKAAANFTVESQKLSVLAKAGDTDGFAAQWKVTGDTCGACHKEYRAK